MIRKTEKYYIKKVKTHKSKFKDLNRYGEQNIKRTTYWLVGFIPVFTTEEVVKGDYEYSR